MTNFVKTKLNPAQAESRGVYFYHKVLNQITF